MNKKTIIIFIRSYNDIDHSTPLIDTLKKDYKVIVYSKVHINRLLPNQNIKYLQKLKDIKLKYLFEDYLNIYDKFLEFIFQRINYLNKIINPNEFFQKVFNVLLKSIQKKIYKNLKYKKKWCIDLFSDKHIHSILFDWSDLNSFPNVNIVKYAKEKKINIIGIPHGVEVFTNEDIVDKNTINKKMKVQNSTNFKFDYILVQNEISTQTFIRDGYNLNRIYILGAARYDKFWLRTINKSHFNYNDILKSFFKNKKINIIFFLNKLHYNVDKKLLIKLIQLLADLELINLIIKPHTRGMKTDFFNIKPKNRDKVKIVNNEIPSYALTKWCDAGIVWGSSIGIQLVIDNKELIYPKFLHKNETIYDLFLKNTIVSNPKEVVNKILLLNRYKKNSYTEAQRSYFMNKIINNEKQEPLEKYINFFKNISYEK